MARRQLTLDNTIAAELAGSEDTVLRELEDRLGCDVYLRGNVLTLDGDDADVSKAATMVDELVGLAERGHDLARLVDEAIAESGAESPAEMGKVMGSLMPKVGGRADGKRVSAMVKDRLTT